jgi:hypothetical protein
VAAAAAVVQHARGVRTQQRRPMRAALRQQQQKRR